MPSRTPKTRSLHKVVRKEICLPGDRDTVKRAVQTARPKELCRTYKNGRSALHEAARFGRAFAVGRLLRRAEGVLAPSEFARYVNARDSYGCPPLLYAAASLRSARCQSEFRRCVRAARHLARCASVDRWAVHECAVGNDRQCGFGYVALDKITRGLHQSPYIEHYAGEWDAYNDGALVALMTELATAPVAPGVRRRVRHPLLSHDENRYTHHRALVRILELDIPAVALGLMERVPAIRAQIRDVVFNKGGPRTLRALAWRDQPELRDLASWHANLMRFGVNRQTRGGKRDFDVYIANREVLRPWTTKTHALFPASFQKGAWALLVAMSRSMGFSSATTPLWVRVVRSVAADHFERVRGRRRGYPYSAFTDHGIEPAYWNF